MGKNSWIYAPHKDTEIGRNLKILDDSRLIIKVVKVDKTSKKDPAKDGPKKLPTSNSYTAKTAIDLNAVSLYSGHSNTLNYLRAVRNRINLFVHRNYSPFMGEGEAVLHFVLTRDGFVKSAGIIKNNLAGNKRLRELCLDSIHLSSPFKKFPPGLDLPHAAFNISISFKRK